MNGGMPTNIQFMTASQVARRLQLSVERVRQLARSGRLPPDQTTELGRLWLPETVDAFAATRNPWGRYETTGEWTPGKRDVE